MGKRHQRKQDVCLLAETNSVDDMTLEGAVAHAESQELLSAWGLDSTQQCRDEKTNRCIQFISDRSYIPIQIYRGKDGAKSPQIVGRNVTTIAAQTEDEEMVFLEERRSKDSRLLWVGICLALLTLTVCITVLLKMQGG